MWAIKSQIIQSNIRSTAQRLDQNLGQQIKLYRAEDPMLDQDIGSDKELYRCLRIPIMLDIRSRNERLKISKFRLTHMGWPYSCTRG